MAVLPTEAAEAAHTSQGVWPAAAPAAAPLQAAAAGAPLQLTPPGVPLRVPLHPGRFLEKQFLQPLGISQTRAAELLGVSRRRINELVMGHRAMSPDTAVRCAIAFGTSASFWLQLQANWDCHHAWRVLREQARAGVPLPPVLVAGLGCADTARRVVPEAQPA